MELEHEDYRRDGFFFDPASLHLDLYRLLCCFYASPRMAALRGGLGTERIGRALWGFEETEITRLLVSVAATVRIVHDREKDHFKGISTDCGLLTANISQPRRIGPLSLREACNKIIHATKFNFDAAKIARRYDVNFVGQVALRPFVHLYGSHNDAEWKAKLDVFRFVACNIELVHG